MRASAVFAALLAASVLAVGCGSDDGDSAEDDQAAATRAVTAFGEAVTAMGFSEAAEDDDDDDSDLEFASEDCQAFAEAFPDEGEDLPGETADEDSPSYERGDLAADGGEQSVEGSVGVVEDDGDLDDVFDLYGDDRLGPCLVEALDAGFQEQATADGMTASLTDTEVTRTELPDVGDDVVGLQLSAVVDVSGFRVPVSLDIGVARDGRVAALVMATTLGEGSEPVDVGGLLRVLLDEATKGS